MYLPAAQKYPRSQHIEHMLLHEHVCQIYTHVSVKIVKKGAGCEYG